MNLPSAIFPNDPAHVASSLFPVFIFLLALIYLDSYKLVRLRSVLVAIVFGGFVALVALFVNSRVAGYLPLDVIFYTRYISPVIEEILKSVYLIYLIRSNRVGFMVDAAIYGFAIGAGFAFAENIYYLQSLQTTNLLVWIVRGFGTAIMHGGTTAIVGIVSKNISDRHSSENPVIYLPGLGIAIAIHSIFNHFVLPPLLSTLSLLVALPLIIVAVFAQSERATRSWLSLGFDTDTELLEIITTGELSETPVGIYLQSLKSSFPGEVVADMLCYLQLHLELALRAKGILLMRETGFQVNPDPELKEKINELKYLEKSIGRTGRLAMLPFLQTSSRDLWQLYMVE
jgi:RsiW-degrading membrane proteinase PrsW (M82 family)